MVKFPVLLLCVLLVSPIVAAQETFFSEIMEVRVTNVDVVVTGRDGKPVTGLDRNDFEVYEDGVRKEITNFIEVRGGPSASLTAARPGEAITEPVASSDDVRRRDITIFIDNAVLHPLRRNQILPPLQQFVRENVRGGDTVSIATWGLSLKIELEPTSDREAIDAAVARLGSAASPSNIAQYREEF